MNLYDLSELPPHQRHSATSRAAAASVEPRAETLRRLVLDALRAAPEGLTDEEIQAATGLGGNTARPRRIECVAARLVRDSGRKRATRSGRQAVVWVVV